MDERGSRGLARALSLAERVGSDGTGEYVAEFERSRASMDGLRAARFTGGASLHHMPVNARCVPDFEWHGACKW